MIIERITNLAAVDTSPWSDFWYTATAQRTRSGVDVNEDAAMTFSACWAATRLLSGTAGYLPLELKKSMDGGGSKLLDTKPLYRILHFSPNPEMSSMTWRATCVNQQVNWGNCYSEIERNGSGEVAALWPIHASRVTLKSYDGGGLYYQVRNNDGSRTELPYEDVLHIPSFMTDDGRTGKGVIRAARESIGHAIATERYGADWFGNGGRLTGVLKHPARMEREARDNLRREWNEIYHNPDAPQKTAVLWEGMDYTSIGSDPEDSQFIMSRQHNIEEVARWYGVPPHLIGHLLRSTNNNIEAQGVEYVKYSLLPWLKMWEQEIWRKLLTKQQQDAGWFAKFTVDALERGDATTRTQALQQRFFNGSLTLNEWREIEDCNPIGPEGDIHFVQSAMIPLEFAAKGPQQSEPATQQGDEPVDEPKDEPADDKQKQAAYSATLDVLAEIVGVMLDKEAQAAIHAAKKPAEFLAWLDTFYVDHSQRMHKALAKPIRACILASGAPLIVDDTLKTAVAAHVESSRNALLEASGGPPSGFSTAIERCVLGWNRTEITDFLSQKG